MTPLDSTNGHAPSVQGQENQAQSLLLGEV
jgi:hypothetical protein